MSITIDLPVEVEARLVALAEVRGVDVSTCAQILIQDSLAPMSVVQDEAAERRAAFNRFLAEFTQFSHKTPVLPDEAFTRESIYQDHD